ncbi:hypothetical protein [Chryseobacterium sp.]|uniref:hypothetical protein n=1 Tax=Chryseobacterium sp. TaxID=1871047 RepID=UPI00388E35FE
MNLTDIQAQIDIFKQENKTIEAAKLLIDSFGLNDDNFGGFGFREELDPNSILLTAEGVLGEPQKVMIPKNLFDFDLSLVLNVLSHEMHHVRQKAPGKVIEDRNEREFQAYYEMLFHHLFPQIPELSAFYKRTFAEKALEYYRRMGEGLQLQEKYSDQKSEVEQLLSNLS